MEGRAARVEGASLGWSCTATTEADIPPLPFFGFSTFLPGNSHRASRTFLALSHSPSLSRKVQDSVWPVEHPCGCRRVSGLESRFGNWTEGFQAIADKHSRPGPARLLTEVSSFTVTVLPCVILQSSPCVPPISHLRLRLWVRGRPVSPGLSWMPPSALVSLISSLFVSPPSSITGASQWVKTHPGPKLPWAFPELPRLAPSPPPISPWLPASMRLPAQRLGRSSLFSASSSPSSAQLWASWAAPQAMQESPPCETDHTDDLNLAGSWTGT